MKLTALASMVLASAAWRKPRSSSRSPRFSTSTSTSSPDRRIPPDSGGDVGAFRLSPVCRPMSARRTDPIVYPQQEFAGHRQRYQNSGDGWLGGFETYQSLRTNPTVLTSCTGHHVNRSRYWVPWLQTAQGQILRPDVWWIIADEFAGGRTARPAAA